MTPLPRLFDIFWLSGPRTMPGIHQALKRLECLEITEVEEDLVPEAGVEQVEHGMLGAAHVEIDSAPCFDAGCSQ